MIGAGAWRLRTVPFMLSSMASKETKTERRKWTRDELVVAMNLYCRLPFGKLDQRTPKIRELAAALDRTPGSLAMKLNNFASFDPDLKARGVKGLKGASKLDREVWDEFHADWEAMAIESEWMRGRLFQKSNEMEGVSGYDISGESAQPLSGFQGPTELSREVRVRLGQAFFRRAILSSYNERCCITGNPIPALLEASHIVPHSKGREFHVDPRNGLCLARTHHAAFDRGYISFASDGALRISKKMKRYLPSPILENEFIAFEGHPLTLPERYPPAPEFLDYHRKNIYLG